MIDKNDPRQGPINNDSADDDVIIDLTDEVIIKPKEDEDIIELIDELPDERPETDEKVRVSKADEDPTASPITSKSDTLEEDVVFELDDQFADDEIDKDEDELIASAINASLVPDEEETERQDDEFELQAPDDDVIILENEQDVVEESLAETTSDEASGAERDEDVFDLEEEIELEYEMDEEDNELIALDDERTEGQPDFVELVLGEADQSGPRDQTEEPMEYIEFDSYRQADITDLNEDEDRSLSNGTVIDAAESENDDIDELPDLTTVTELDFEEDDELENTIAAIGEETDSGDEIIARTVEHSIGPDDRKERFRPAEDTEVEPQDELDFIALDAEGEDDEQVVALEEDEPLDFEDDKGLLVDLEDVTDLEDDDEIIPLDGSDDFEAGTEDEIVEITEFDQHYPADSDNMLKKAGILDAAGEEEDDFLELIDVEEDRETEEETVVGADETDEKTEFTALDEFFSEELEKEEPELTAAETDFSNAASEEPLPAKETAEDAEDTPVGELAVGKAASEPEDEAFDFNFDPGAIARQVDRLDAFLSEDPLDEPEVASLPEEDAAGENGLQENIAPEPNFDELAGFPAEQIDKAIERVINEKFAHRIEKIIYDVIEKAVAKEIDRLKGVLLDKTPPDDNY